MSADPPCLGGRTLPAVGTRVQLNENAGRFFAGKSAHVLKHDWVFIGRKGAKRYDLGVTLPDMKPGEIIGFSAGQFDQ